jgi:hypothetical protein
VLAKERCSQLLLKTLHLQAEGGWCASRTVCRLGEITNIMRRDESAQGVEIEIMQWHPALRLHEIRRGSRINDWCGFGEVYWKTCSTGTWKMYAMRKATSTEDE